MASKQFNLIRELAITQFKLKYTGSVLGYIWSLVKPLMLFTIMYTVFVQLFKIKADTPHFAFQLLLGIVLWSFFSETVGAAMSVIASNGALIKKASFYRPILVIATTVTSSITLLINLSLVMLISIPTHQAELGLRSLMIVPLLLEFYLLILGLSLLLSSLFVFFRDLGHIWEVFSQILFYASAVVYPLSRAFLGDRTDIVASNPVAQVIQDIRSAVISSKIPWTSDLLGHSPAMFIPFAIVITVVLVGGYTFHRLSPRFAEYL